jgi:hypothetical protein
LVRSGTGGLPLAASLTPTPPNSTTNATATTPRARLVFIWNILCKILPAMVAGSCRLLYVEGSIPQTGGPASISPNAPHFLPLPTSFRTPPGGGRGFFRSTGNHGTCAIERWRPTTRSLPSRSCPATGGRGTRHAGQAPPLNDFCGSNGGRRLRRRGLYTRRALPQ